MINCKSITDLVLKPVERIDTYTERVCSEVSETIERWEERFEQQCKEVGHSVCSWFPWPISEVCDWVTEIVCTVVSVSVKIIEIVVQTVCSIVRHTIRTITWVVEPACFVVDFLTNWALIILSFLINIVDFLLCMAFGIGPLKHMHATVTVLAGPDGQPVADMAHVDDVVSEARKLIRQSFDVRLSIGSTKIVQVPKDRLDVTACDSGQLFSSEAIDLTNEGSGEVFGDIIEDVGRWGLTGLIYPTLHMIFIRSIIEGNDAGCHLPGTDYVIVDHDSSGLVLAHEVGHAGTLWHSSDEANLMHSHVTDNNVTRFQVCQFRASRFVGYLP
ncbi:hypothetical protein ACFWM1_24410 [Nocardia sp. NPDC058379]|uniref:hypothetical protein n=1 Tax=unclassified Nocardia TaxID=2637762 RepID=UPI00365FACFF